MTFSRDQMQARNPLRFRGRKASNLRHAGVYPPIPAGWPNRSVRRAIRFARPSRLPAVWASVLASRPELRAAIKELP